MNNIKNVITKLNSYFYSFFFYYGFFGSYFAYTKKEYYSIIGV